MKGDAETAARLLASSEPLYEDVGGSMPWIAKMTDEALARIRSELDESVFAEAWEEGRRLSADEAVALALGEADTES